VIKLALPSSLYRELDSHFQSDWRDSLQLTLNHLLESKATAKADEILVNSYWKLKAKTWITKPNVVKKLFESNLDSLSNCVSGNFPAQLASNLDRFRGSGITPDMPFWKKLCDVIKTDPVFKGRLIRSINAGTDFTAEDDSTPEGILFLKRNSFNLRDYQQEMIDRIYSVVVDGNLRLMLKLPTGAGKTRVALEAVYRLMRDDHVKIALWIADDKNLCQQAIDSALSTFQGSNDNIENLILVSFFDSNALIDLQMLHETHAKPMLIVCTPHQLEENLELIPNIDVFIMDEAHTSIERRFDLFERLEARTLLGLSATPPTHWRETLTLTPINSFDATTTSTEEFLRIRGILSTIHTVRRKVIDDINHQVIGLLFKGDGKVNYHHPFVTYSILENVRKDILSSSVSSVIVFVDRIEQASVLSSAFNALMPEHQSAHLDGDKMTTSQRQTILRRFKKGEIDVLFNVKLLREGFDAPNIDGVYLAQLNNPSPETKKYIQMIGRGLRGTASEGGTENCLVVELDFDYE